MEGCPHLLALDFDLKLSLETINLCEKIPQYITANYLEDGTSFSNECEQLNRLREEATNCAIDELAIQCLKRYYCQLLLLRSRFPMLPDGECCVRFTWEDGFQKDENTFDDIRFEEASILYNIGAVYSRMATSETRKTSESLKNACTYFRCAAACFEKVRDHYANYSSDFTSELLTCQVDILLAQAHETVLEKSLLDQRPQSVNACLAMQISQYYQAALCNLMKTGISSIVSRRFREWRVALTYKSSYFLAITYYYSSLIADEGKRHGEAVCYLEAAMEKLKEAWRSSEKISTDRSNVYKEVHTCTYDLILRKYTLVKRDNDNVYYEKVPVLNTLPVVQGAIVVRPQGFDCHDPNVLGSDIFHRLIPMRVHVIASEYSEEKRKLLHEVLALIETKNHELGTFMNGLQLDRKILSNEYLRLPRELLDCCAIVSNRSNMSKDLTAAIRRLDYTLDVAMKERNEFEQLLEHFQDYSDVMKSNQEFQDLQTNVRTIRDIISTTNENQVELRQIVTEILEHLKILGSSSVQIEKTLPRIAELDEESNRSKLAHVVLLYEKIETMKKQRDILVNDFRRKLQDDDIKKLVLIQQPENYKSWFSEQLKKHDEAINMIKQNCLLQDSIVNLLREANESITSVRAKMSITLDARNRLIEDYIHSFESYDDVLTKIKEKIEFYNNQRTKLKTLNERFTMLQSQHQSKLHMNTVNQDQDAVRVADHPRLKDYLAAMKPNTWGSPKPSRLPVKLDDDPCKSKIFTSYHSNASNLTEQAFTNLSASYPHAHISAQLPNQFEQAPIPSAPPSSFASLQLSTDYQRPPFNHPNSFGLNSEGQSQTTFNVYTPQQFYPSQPYQVQQSIYQPIVHPHQATSVSTQSFSNDNKNQPYPSVSPYQVNGESGRIVGQSRPIISTDLDPYRPQPIGAYDIPTTPGQTIFLPPLPQPQDVYRPGGFLGINQIQRPLIMNYNNCEQNQVLQCIPTSLSSTFSHLSINSMSNH